MRTYTLSCLRCLPHEWTLITNSGLLCEISCRTDVTEVTAYASDASNIALSLPVILYREGREAERLAIKRYLGRKWRE